MLREWMRVVTAGAVFAASAALHAQPRTDHPDGSRITQPVRLIVPNAPGGPTDTVARVVGQKLAERLGVPVIVDNRPGASGTVGGDLVAKSASGAKPRTAGSGTRRARRQCMASILVIVASKFMCRSASSLSVLR